MLEFLEKNWAPALPRASAVRLAVRALLEVVDSGAKNMEIAVIARGQALQVRFSKYYAFNLTRILFIDDRGGRGSSNH